MHRKICTLITILAFVILSAGCAFGEVAIDEEHFPDSTFRAYVINHFDTDGDGILNDSEIEGAGWIGLYASVYGRDEGGTAHDILRVKSLQGIEYLTALTWLDCAFNGLTYLDLSKNKALTYLDCSYNMLETLNVNGCIALGSLNCASNRLQELDLSSCKSLGSLQCSYNYIKKLDLRQYGSVIQSGILNNVNMNGFAEISINAEEYMFENYSDLSGLRITPCGNDGNDNLYQINLKEYVPPNAESIYLKYIFYDNGVNGHVERSGFKSENGIVTFNEWRSAYGPVNNIYAIEIFYNIGGDRYYLDSGSLSSGENGHVTVYREAPAFDIYKAPVLEPANVKVDVIEGKLDADKIICSMDEEHYYGKDGQVLTEQSIADYPYSEYGKLGFAADGNSRLILRVKSDKPGYASFSFNGETGATLEPLTNCTQNTRWQGKKHTLNIEATEVSGGGYQASAVLIAPESFPENKKFPSDKFNVNVTFTVEESFDIGNTGYAYPFVPVCPSGYYHTADTKTIELTIEAAPVLLIPGMFDNAGKTFGRYNNTGIWSALQRCGFKEEHIYEWDYDEHKNEGPNQVLAKNNNDLFKKLAIILNDYAGGGIVCTKVDVIAHGMGGLMARKFLHESGKDSHDGNNWSVRSYKQGMVRRLITVATPHGGTPWADGLDKKIFITTMYNGLLNSTFKEEHPNVEKLLKPFTLLINTVVPSQEMLNNFLTIINSAWSELKTTKAREYGLPAGVPIHVIAGDSRADNAIQTIWTGVTTLVDKVGGANLDVFNLPSFTLGNLGKLCEWISDKLKNIPKGQLLKLKLKIAGKVLGTISFVWDFPSIIKVLADVANFSVFNFNPNDFIVSVSSAAPYFIERTVYANEGVDIFSPENNDRYSHWSICQQYNVGLDIAYLLKGPAYNFTTFDSEVYEQILSTSNKSASNVGAFPDDIDDSAEFEIAESLDLTVEPSVFALNTNSQTVKITLASAKPLSNDVFCTFGNDDTCRFFKIPNADSTRTKFEAAVDASALFVSMDNGAVEFLCMSCMSDDDGISGMYVSNTVSVDISGQTPAELIAPKITAATLEEGTVYRSYSAELKASGTPLIYWRITGGKLPGGLGLSSFGKISGTPYETGTFTFTAEAINTAGAVSQEFTLIIHTEEETAITIDENTFPDENFRAFIKETFDTDNDGKLTLNFIEGVTAIDCSGRGIKSLKGIELFTGLVYLTCTNNELTELDLSRNVNIYGVACQNNKLERINLANCSKLFQIWLDNNNLTSVDFTGCPELNILSCKGNKITSLDLSKCRNISELDCDEGVEIIYSDTPGGSETLISANNFPDETFRKYVADNFDFDKNGRLSTLEIAGIRVIDVTGMGISTLKGIEHFPSLEYLSCSSNDLTELDISQNVKMKGIACDNNRLETIDLTHSPELVQVWFSYNKITSVDLTYNPELKILYLLGNMLTELDISGNPNLEEIGVHENKLTSLDVSSLAKLRELHCGDNLLETLTLGDKPALLRLYCYRNDLTELNLIGCPALKELGFGGNKISAIDITSCKELESLAFWDNFVTELDISEHVKLKDCIFGNNKVKTLNVGNKPELLRLHCYSNDLSTVDITECPVLQDFSCEGNKISVLDVTKCKELETLYCKGNLLKVLDLSECPKITNLTVDEGVELIYTKEGTPPEILMETLTNAITNQEYSYQLTASGATPITWTHTGKLPAELTLSESGLISGTPTKAGKYTFTVTASNSYGKSSQKYTLQVFDPVSITTASLKAGTIGKSYNVTMRAKGTKTITWSAEGLPNGLSINEKGKISGKPTAYGMFNVKVIAQNGAGSVTKNLTLEVKAIAPKLSGSLAKATLNQPYSSALKVTGSMPITWSVEGDLPEGLTLDASTGIISGTPTSYAKSGYKIIITAMNDGGSKSKKITLKVNGKAPKITAKLPQAAAGETYSAELSATGSEPITWTANLPEYLTLDGSTISGIVPASVKSFKITVYASNPVKENVKKNYTVKVSAKKSSLNAYNDTGITDNRTGINSGTSGSVPDLSERDVYSYSRGVIIVAELGEISCDMAGMYDFEIKLPDYVPEGSELVYFANSDKPSEDDDIAEFYDEVGGEISAVPENRRIAISIWLNPETVYNPVIAVKD